MPLADVCYFISDKRKVKMQTRTGEQDYYGRLDDTEKKLALRSANFQYMVMLYAMEGGTNYGNCNCISGC